MSNVHSLKTWPEYFEEVLKGNKPFEVRKDDRGFKAGDALHLCEYDKSKCVFTGRNTCVEVTYLYRLPDGEHVVLGFETPPVTRLKGKVKWLLRNIRQYFQQAEELLDALEKEKQ